ncbi:MAG: hypothetical protein RL670_605, partial [Actinomycetota bacterium]
MGLIPANYSSLEYWLLGGGGGGGTGGNSGYTGAGGGAGGFLEGTATGLPTGTASETVTTLKVGMGGRFAINDGDSVSTKASNGAATVFNTTGLSLSAAGGGAGGSGTTNPANAPLGLAGGSGGGSAQTGGTGGAGSQGYAGGAGSASASGGGGGAKGAGVDANGGAGGSGGKGLLLPLTSTFGTPAWVGAGGSGNGSTSAGSAFSAFGATAAATDASSGSGSGGGGAGFASASSGTSRGGYGGGGFILINAFMPQPFADSAPTSFQSGKPSSVPLVLSVRDINGDVITAATGTISLSSATSGCTLQGSYVVSVVNGRATIPNITLYSTTTKPCQLNYTLTTGGVGSFTAQTQTSPNSIVINTSATTGTCSFVQGFFTCPYGTVANLNVSDLNAQLNSTDVVLAANNGDTTVNSPISGSVGSLSIATYGVVRLNAGITLGGTNKSLTIQALNNIIGNESATSGNPTAFSTNGGGIYLYTVMTSLSGAGYVKLSNYNTFTTNGGPFIASGGPDPTVGYAQGNSAAQTSDITANGIYIATGASINTGAGDVTLRGKIGGSNSQYYTPGGSTWTAAGVSMQPSSAVTTTSGAVTITGLDPGFSYDNQYRTGVKVDTASITTGSGAINVTGTTTSDTISNLTTGIYLSGATLSSTSGNVSLTGSVPTTTSGVINFASPVSAIGSTSGDVSIGSGSTNSSIERLDNLQLTGSGNHTLSFMNPSITANGAFHALGSGNFVLTAPGVNPFSNQVTVPATADFGTSYSTIKIADNAPASSSAYLSINANLTASSYVYLRGGQIAGSGSVTAPGLAMAETSTTAANFNQLTGASDVDTLALTHGAANPTGSIGITDADGWTPGTVAGVVGVYGVAKNISTVTTPSTSAIKGQVLPQQPVIKIVDAYGLALTSSNLSLANYTLTPSTTPNTSLTPTTPVSFNSSGQSTFSGLKFTSNGLFNLSTTVSPTLTGTSTLSFSNISIAASTNPTSIVASPSTINATSRQACGLPASFC